MTIKKFKSGKIKIVVNTLANLEDIKQALQTSQITINRINGYNYLIDEDTQKVFEGENIAKLLENKAIYFYPLSKKLSKSLLQDLDNGY